MSDQHLFVEVFPIRAESLPPLFAYRLITEGDEFTQQHARRMGGRTANALREAFGGQWAWIGGHLLTDTTVTAPRLDTFVDDLRAAYPRLFAALRGIHEEFDWHPTSGQIADWVVRGPASVLDPIILDALARTVFTIKSTRVQREYRMRTWSVADAPALSVSVISRLLYEPDLQAYIDTLSEATSMVGLWVSDKLTGLQGEILRLVGLVGEQRARLLTLSSNATMRTVIEAAPAAHWVVRVGSGIRDYDYVTDALDLVIRPEDITQFAINKGQLDRALHLKPAAHAQMVKIVADVVKEIGIIGNAYATKTTPELFQVATPQISLLWGDGRPRPFVREKLAVDFLAHGAAQLPKTLPNATLKIAVIDGVAEGARDFLEALRRAFDRESGLKLEITRVRDMRVVSQTNLDSAVRLLAKENADVLLILLPDETNAADQTEEEAVSERYARLQTIGRGLSSLIIHEADIHDPNRMSFLIMGLLARVGGTPYLLAEPLPYADHIVGLNLVTQDKREGIYLTGIARIYRSDGLLLYHHIAGASVQPGEGIPASLLPLLLPSRLLRGKRVVLHIEGKLTREAGLALGSWEDELDAQFSAVEIIRAGVPRLYALVNGRIEPPAWGSLFRLNESEAFLQSSETSVQPLHIRAEAPFTIEKALESVLVFTLFHYGASRPARHPVTVHQSESIEAGIGRGIFPTSFEGETAFWL